MKIRLLSLLLPLAAACYGTEPALPAVYSLSAKDLAAARERLAHNDPALMPALAQLRAEADKELRQPPVSVMDKTRMPPSGDKHDYLSLAPYHWPDPTKPNGLPYIRRDGETNPESKEGTDAKPFGALGGRVVTLGLAYFFTHDERYAEHAAKLARVWFIDPATRMNPHLRYAQAIRGINDGRGTGILESRGVANVLDGLALIAGSPAWTPDDQKAMRTWLEAYYLWVTKSPNGQHEHNAQNNHGSWYDAQVAHFALALGRVDDARKIASTALKRRIAVQIKKDGRQPLELVRTKSFDYCCFNIEALQRLACVSANAGVDLWSLKTDDGRSLLAAVRFMAPYREPAKKWFQDDIKDKDPERLQAILADAFKHTGDPEIKQVLERYSDAESRSARWHLLLNLP